MESGSLDTLQMLRDRELSLKKALQETRELIDLLSVSETPSNHLAFAPPPPPPPPPPVTHSQPLTPVVQGSLKPPKIKSKNRYSGRNITREVQGWMLTRATDKWYTREEVLIHIPGLNLNNVDDRKLIGSALYNLATDDPPLIIRTYINNIPRYQRIDAKKIEEEAKEVRRLKHLQRYVKIVDPDNLLSEDERLVKAEALMRETMSQLGKKGRAAQGYGKKGRAAQGYGKKGRAAQGQRSWIGLDRY